MRRSKLPFSISLERKYNDLNIDDFFDDWREHSEERKPRQIKLANDLHIELGKFKTYNIDINEIVDLAVRYALSKQEFRRLSADLIEEKKKQ